MRAFVTSLVILAAAIPTGAAERRVTTSERYPSVPGKRVVVDTASIDVELRALDVTDIEVVYDLKISGVSAERADSWVQRHTPTVSDTPEQITITAAPGSDGFMGLGHLTARARVIVRVPFGTVPDLTTTTGRISVRGDFPAARPLRLRSADGHIDLVGAAHSVDIRAASGDASLELFRPLEHLFARSASGRIDLVGGAREVEVDTASGTVRLASLSGPGQVSTTSGDIVLDWVRLDDGAFVSVRSSSGSIRLVLPPDTRPKGRLTTTRGRVQSGFPGVVVDTGDAVELAGSGPRIEAETASGDIELRPAELEPHQDSTPPGPTTPSPSPGPE